MAAKVLQNFPIDGVVDDYQQIDDGAVVVISGTFIATELAYGVECLCW